MSEQDCKGLGGVVSTVFGCDAGKACFTTDANGVIHRVCINE